MLEQHYCEDWVPAAEVVSCGGSQKHPGATCHGSRFRGLACWIGVTTVTRGRQPRKKESEFLLLGPCTLGWDASVPNAGSERHLGITCWGGNPRELAC